jgi:trimethylamine---corrinoid protein Co-methyltransferase
MSWSAASAAGSGSTTAAMTIAAMQGPPLGTSEIEAVHSAALRLLTGSGVAILDQDALDVFVAHGARTDGRRVFIDERLVQRALETAPAAFTLAGRSPGRDLRFGGGDLVIGSASGPAYVLDGAGRREGTLDDLRLAIKLGHVSRNIDFHGVCVEPLDVPAAARTRVAMHARLLASDKPTESWAALPADVDVAVRVHEILFGAQWHQVPRALAIINTSSPLQLSAEAGQALVRLARLGQPLCVTPCIMGGTTGPMTLAGILALQHAEALAGLVLVQLACEGCPFLYGGTSSISSMKTGALLMGVPEFWVLTEATAQVAHWCGLPLRAGGALTDAHLPDAQAGIESALSLEASVRAGVDFILQAAGILSSFNCFSAEQFVIDDELLGVLAARGRRVAVTPDQLAIEVSEAAGPGGNFLLAAHTKAHARDFERAPFFVREPVEGWSALGGRDLRAAAAERVVVALAGYEAPDDLDPVVRRQLDEYCLG